MIKKIFVTGFLCLMSGTSYSSETEKFNISDHYDTMFKLPSKITVEKILLETFNRPLFVETTKIHEKLYNQEISGLTIQEVCEDAIYFFLEGIKDNKNKKESFDFLSLNLHVKKVLFIKSLLKNSHNLSDSNKGIVKENDLIDTILDDSYNSSDDENNKN